MRRILFSATVTAYLLACTAIGMLRSIGPGLYWDLAGFVATGRAAGEGLDPYRQYAEPWPTLVGRGLDALCVLNLNPPLSVPAFQLLALIQPQVLVPIWYAAGLALYAGAILILACRYRPSRIRLLLAFAMIPLWETLRAGQIYLLLLYLTAGAWLALERRRDLLASVLIGALVAMKPPFALWPLLLLAAGHRRVAFISLGTAAILFLLPLPFYGPGLYLSWLHISVQVNTLTPGNMSVLSLFSRVGLRPLALGLGVLAIAAAAWHVRRRRWTALPISELSLSLAMLFSPILWPGYLMLLLPALYSRPRWQPLTVVALFCVTYVPLIVSEILFVRSPLTIGAVLGLSAILLMTSIRFPLRRSS